MFFPQVQYSLGIVVGLDSLKNAKNQIQPIKKQLQIQQAGVTDLSSYAKEAFYYNLKIST